MSLPSNDSIMNEYMVKFGAMRNEGQTNPQLLLETLYMSERFEAGGDLAMERTFYKPTVWDGVDQADIKARLVALDRFMKIRADQIMTAWGVSPV